MYLTGVEVAGWFGSLLFQLLACWLSRLPRMIVKRLLKSCASPPVSCPTPSNLAAAGAAREAGNSPNTVMAAAAAIIGPGRVERTMMCAKVLIDLFAAAGLKDAQSESFNAYSVETTEAARTLFLASPAEASDPRPEAMLQAVGDRGARSVFLDYLKALGARPSRDAVLAAITTTIAWGPLMRKRISRITAESLPWYLRLYGVMIGASIPDLHHKSGSLWGISRQERFSK